MDKIIDVKKPDTERGLYLVTLKQENGLTYTSHMTKTYYELRVLKETFIEMLFDVKFDSACSKLQWIEHILEEICEKESEITRENCEEIHAESCSICDR